MTFTEFSYQLLQGYDFLRLKQIEIQIGGKDQWGNIAAGCDLVRKVTGEEGYGVTVDLLINSQGQKLGKSEGNAVWLDDRFTTPYELYQYLYNVSDADAIKFLKQLTFINEQEIKEIEIRTAKEPQKREAQSKLASAVTSLVHGSKVLDALKSTDILFKLDYTKLRTYDVATLNNILSSVENVRIDGTFEKNIVNILVLANVRSNKSEVRRLIKMGGLSINGNLINHEGVLSDNDILGNKYIIVKVGKKNYTVIEFI